MTDIQFCKIKKDIYNSVNDLIIKKISNYIFDQIINILNYIDNHTLIKTKKLLKIIMYCVALKIIMKWFYYSISIFSRIPKLFKNFIQGKSINIINCKNKSDSDSTNSS